VGLIYPISDLWRVSAFRYRTLGMNEAEFISAIDCGFPHERPTQWRRLSAAAARISPNAAFMVLHEVCRAPASRRTTESQARAIISHLQRRFRHPALKAIYPAVASYPTGKRLRPSAAAAQMRKLAPHTGQYNALNICFFSADDRQGALERTYERIVRDWADSESLTGASD
jgi:hypothetical protein